MSAGLTITIAGKSWEFYWGGGSGKWILAQVSATIFTIGIELSIKV